MKIKGIITAMVTPFDEQEQINEAATKRLINKLISAGVHGIFILGTNGEFYVMDDKEKIRFTEMVVDYVDGRVPVFAGAGACSTKQTIRLIDEMHKAGADAVSVITPYFQKLSQEELAYHYQSIANQSKLPILLYNIPSITQNPLEADTVKTLCKESNIVGIKDSSGNLEYMKDCLSVSEGEDFVLLSGSDSLILKALKIGAVGAIAATSNLLTEIDVAIYENFISNNLEEAQQKQDSIEYLRKVLKRGAQPSVIKRALVLCGFEVGQTRRPIAKISSQADKEILEMLTYYGLKEE